MLVDRGRQGSPRSPWTTSQYDSAHLLTVLSSNRPVKAEDAQNRPCGAVGRGSVMHADKKSQLYQFA